jgi:HSF-type DNA-binding
MNSENGFLMNDYHSRIAYSSNISTATMTLGEGRRLHDATTASNTNEGRGEEGKSGDGSGNGQRGRRFVTHDYHDYANDMDGFMSSTIVDATGVSSSRTSEDQSFPVRLHYCLNDMERDGLSDIVSWQPHGRCFVVHNKERFIKEVLGRYEKTRLVHA